MQIRIGRRLAGRADAEDARHGAGDDLPFAGVAGVALHEFAQDSQRGGAGGVARDGHHRHAARQGVIDPFTHRVAGIAEQDGGITRGDGRRSRRDGRRADKDPDNGNGAGRQGGGGDDDGKLGA